MSTQIIAVASAKGGAGKTTTTFSLAMGASKQGLKLLILDLDPNMGVSKVLGIYGKEPTIADYILQGSSLKDTILPISLPIRGHSKTPLTLDLIAGSRKMHAIGLSLSQLEQIVNSLEGQYDLILLDTQPNESYFEAPMKVANVIVIPTMLDWLSMESAAWTFNLALRFQVENKVGGVVITNAKRPLSKVAKSLLDGLTTLEVAYPTILWAKVLWVEAATGAGVSIPKELIEVSEQLYKEIISGRRCEKMIVESFAELSLNSTEDN